VRGHTYFEVLLPVETHRHGLINDLVVDAQGLVHAPMGPGLGIAIDFDLVKRNTIVVLR
jgi:L-alanine-DL-glutamate epimerase-like enolase superfamily enzyme